MTTSDKYSKDRLNTLNQLMSNLFGQKWIFVIITYIIFLLIIMFQLYLITKDNVVVNLNDNNFHKFVLLMLCILVFIVILTFSIFYFAYKDYKTQIDKEKNNKGDFSNISKGKEVFKLIVMVLLMVILLVFVSSILFHHNLGQKK
jgi:magnesium-transporting ATPase (P-type)